MLFKPRKIKHSYTGTILSCPVKAVDKSMINTFQALLWAYDSSIQIFSCNQWERWRHTHTSLYLLQAFPNCFLQLYKIQISNRFVNLERLFSISSTNFALFILKLFRNITLFTFSPIVSVSSHVLRLSNLSRLLIEWAVLFRET